MDNELHIIHCDLDAFFASVEQRDNPDLQGKPVIVGGAESSRGVVSTCSYEARRYGVRSAMSIANARRLCPDGIFLPVDMKRYAEASQRVFSIMESYTPLIEPLSIDEAFLDVAGCSGLFGSVVAIAEQIKRRVAEEVRLIISAGISYNKYLAKLATDMGKPDGLTVISEEEALAVTGSLPVGRIWGIGPKGEKALNGLGVITIEQLRSYDPRVLQRVLGNHALDWYELAWCIDRRPVQVDAQRKSIGREVTFSHDLTDFGDMERCILQLSMEVGMRLRRSGAKARAITLKYRLGDFKTATKRHQLGQVLDGDQLIFEEARRLLLSVFNQGDRVRLLGIYASCFDDEETLIQGGLFSSGAEANQRGSNLDRAMDEIRQRYGKDAITRASLLRDADGMTEPD